MTTATFLNPNNYLSSGGSVSSRSFFPIRGPHAVNIQFPRFTPAYSSSLLVRTPTPFTATQMHPSSINDDDEPLIVDDFPEFFSNSDDGTTPIPCSLYETRPSVDSQSRRQASSRSTSRANDKVPEKFPFLPFDELIGFHLPEEAAEGLDILFRDRQETKPEYHTSKQVLCECRLGPDLVFQAVGRTVEEARNKAASEALFFLRHPNNN